MLGKILGSLQENERYLELEFRKQAKLMDEATGVDKINLASQLHFLTAAHVRVQDAVANLVSVKQLQP